MQKVRSSSFTGPGMQIKVHDWGLAWFFHNAFLKLSWPVGKLVELESQLTGSFLRGQRETGCAE